MIAFGLDEGLTEGASLSRRHGTTLFMTLLAGWAALLSRLSSQKDLVIGTPSANRGRQEVEGLIGFFVNTLALRMDFANSPTVAELLKQVKGRTLEAQANQDIPFEQVVELAKPVRSLAHSPLFQVMFAWQSADEGHLEFPGLSLEPLMRTSHAVSKFDLTLSLQEKDGGIGGGLEYATALFERETAERTVVYYQTLLEGMVADETQRVDRLDVLPEAERRLVVETWNATQAQYPSERCVHELFEDQVQKTPQATALVHGEQTLSYAQLNTKANRLAHHLRSLGVKPDCPVALVLERSFALVVAQLAILKAGGAYVPLDASFPEERLAFMLRDCGAKVVLTTTDMRLVEVDGMARVDVDALKGKGPAENVTVSIASEAAAYIMYTSGSTGTPKGVVVPHQAIVRLVINNGYAAFEASDRVAFAANPAFDATTMEVWAPLLHGGCCVIIDQEDLLDSQTFC